MIAVPENVCELTLHQVEKRFNSMEVPTNLIKDLLKAAKTLDFSIVSDPVVISRYNESREKVSKFFKAVVYQDIYAGSDDYENLIEFLITLFAIFDAIIQGRLYITDIARQDSSVVAEFLDSYGFEINRIFNNYINVDIAQNVYGILRKKGTVSLMSILLNDIGLSNFSINEYNLNMIDGEFYLIPETVYKSSSSVATSTDPVKLSSVEDALRTNNDDELRQIFKHSIFNYTTGSSDTENNVYEEPDWINVYMPIKKTNFLKPESTEDNS